jgi:uncharacterized membrane protein YdjX (TVP38/TMEM64 family)
VTDAPSPPHRPASLLARFAPLAAIAALLAAAFALGLHKQLSLEALRDNRVALEHFVAAHLVAAAALYMLAYALAVAISLPGALFLTLAGGFLFGTWLGGGATVIAATIGATAIFLAAKTAFGDALRARAAGWLKRFEQGFGDNAFNYLLALRLFPGAPFFIVNLAPAFLGVSLRDYFFATLIGVIPGTLVYSAVGAGLRAAFEAGTAVDPASAARGLFFSPAVIGPVIGLIALSLLPVLAKALRKAPRGL